MLIAYIGTERCRPPLTETCAQATILVDRFCARSGETKMPIQTVTEIESLPHLVRDFESRLLIDDAIAAYYSGALRSSIVSTWTAVVTDIISKIREIELLPDAEAKKFLDGLKVAISSKDKKKGLELMTGIEKNILETAKNKFHFIDSHEHDILERIRADRHKCAHPAFTAENQLFHPSPDLVRSHIVHALQILLTQPPVQGSSNISRFIEDVFGYAFPSDEESVKEYIFSKYINNRKEKFVESLIETILEVPFSTDENELSNKTRVLAWALGVIFEKKEELFAKKAQSFLNQQEHTPPGKILIRICPYLGVSRYIWSFMKTQIQNSLIEIIKKCTIDDIKEHHVLDALNVKEIEACLTKKMNSMDAEDKENLISKFKHKFFVPFAIDMFKDSTSEESIFRIGMEVVVPLYEYFGIDEIILMHSAIKENYILGTSHSAALILEYLFDETIDLFSHTKDSWMSIIENCDPEVYDSVLKKLK